MAPTTETTFSLFLLQTGRAYPAIREQALELESCGYDGLWLVDHFWGAGSPDENFLEGWTTLSALAEATERLRLGLLVNCNSYRPPALLAKMAASLDTISGGRCELGLGAGWMEEEYKAYGYPFPPIAERLAQLEEGLEVITRLFGDQRANFDGHYYQLNDAPMAPKPLQTPLPITLGGAGERVLLRLAARFANRWNCPMNSAAEIPRLRQVLDQHCQEVGRDPSEIVTSEQTVVVIGRDAADYRHKRQLAEERIGNFADLDTVAVAGTPDQVIAGLKAKQAAGVRDFAILFGDLGEADTLRVFAAEVIPALRS